MNTASLELCKELYELSGWEASRWYWADPGGAPNLDATGLHHKVSPAYDLGYLLRELPVFTQIYKDTGSQYRASLSVGSGKPKFFADTPEDAAAKLCIELFKQGVLTPKEAT